jgi:hypothetical protein
MAVDAVFSTAEAAQAYYKARRIPEDKDWAPFTWYVVEPREYEVDALVEAATKT